MVESLTTRTKPALKFHNKKVVLAGRFRWGLDDAVKAVVLSEGGALVSEVDESTDYVIVGADGRGTPAAAKQAEKLNKKVPA